MQPADASSRLDAVAAAVCGKMPVPTWLPVALADAAGYVGTLLQGLADYPKRKELRERLEALNEALAVVEQERRSWPVWMLLEDAGKDVPVSPSQWHEIDRALTTLADLAHRVRDANREGKGRDLHLPQRDGLLSAQEICAAFVARAWHEVRRKEMPHTSPGAFAACEALWRVSGGKRSGWGGDPEDDGTRTGWRQRIEAAKRAYREGRLAIIDGMILGARTRSNLHLKAL